MITLHQHALVLYLYTVDSFFLDFNYASLHVDIYFGYKCIISQYVNHQKSHALSTVMV